jgi:hypothetical protein
MTNTKDIILQFNNILSSFIIQLSPYVGTTYNYKFEQIIKINISLPIERFLVNALPLRDKILNRDETYFNNYENHNIEINKDELILNEILRLKDIYYKLEEQSKCNIWDIFQALLFLGEEYIKLNEHKYT